MELYITSPDVTEAISKFKVLSGTRFMVFIRDLLPNTSEKSPNFWLEANRGGQNFFLGASPGISLSLCPENDGTGVSAGVILFSSSAVKSAP